eukprot:scaffold958_cov325-Prasinococcus_capsulatus_cf.AAC.2
MPESPSGTKLPVDEEASPPRTRHMYTSRPATCSGSSRPAAPPPVSPPPARADRSVTAACLQVAAERDAPGDLVAPLDIRAAESHHAVGGPVEHDLQPVAHAQRWIPSA